MYLKFLFFWGLRFGEREEKRREELQKIHEEGLMIIQI
jgi:hypothetical protein